MSTDDTAKRLQAIELRQQVQGAALLEMARVLSVPQAAAVAAAMLARMQPVVTAAGELPADTDEAISGDLLGLLRALAHRLGG